MTYWQPRTSAPMALCRDEACDQRTDCRRYLERRELAALSAEELPQVARWKLVPKLDSNGRRIGWIQACKSFLPREG